MTRRYLLAQGWRCYRNCMVLDLWCFEDSGFMSFRDAVELQKSCE